jgi:alkylation response protein AidB-like acyl-CoA dehydrogenase
MNTTDFRGRDWIATARALIPLLDAAGPRIDAAGELPGDVVDALHEARLYRMLLPRSLGGAELQMTDFFDVVHAIAQGDASTAWCLSQSSGCAMSAAYMAPEAAKQVFGDPRAVLAWGYQAGPECLARAVDGGWKASGTWNFGSGSRHATWLGGHCRVADGKGERTMLFPRGAATIKADSWNVIGLRGTGSDTYSVSDLFVPSELSVVARATGRDQQAGQDTEPEAEPERREQGPLYRCTPLSVYQSGFSAVALGIARAVLDAFLALALKKTPQGASSPLRDNAWIQARVARSEAKLASCRSWLLEILRAMQDEAAAAGRISFEQRVNLRLASTYAIHEAREVVETAYADSGATAIFAANPFERRVRDMHAVTQQIQASQVHLQTIGQHYLGLKPQTRFL